MVLRVNISAKVMRLGHADILTQVVKIMASRGKKKPARQSTNRLRIIAGEWRGRKLEFPSHDGLRPTSDRVRETLFNWLQSQITGARVLDLCAGSGALGLEAASRGAAEVVMLDTHLPAVEKIRANAELLQAAGVTVYYQSASQYLDATETTADTKMNKPFDIIFLDPPFASELLSSLLPRVLRPNMLASTGVVYVEAARKQSIDLPVGFDWHRQATAGEVQYGLIKPTTS